MQFADYNHARGIFKLGVSQTPLSMPKLLRKVYIDFKVKEGEHAQAHALYECLAGSSGHWKVQVLRLQQALIVRLVLRVILWQVLEEVEVSNVARDDSERLM